MAVKVCGEGSCSRYERLEQFILHPPIENMSVCQTQLLVSYLYSFFPITLSSIAFSNCWFSSRPGNNSPDSIVVAGICCQHGIGSFPSHRNPTPWVIFTYVAFYFPTSTLTKQYTRMIVLSTLVIASVTLNSMDRLSVA